MSGLNAEDMENGTGLKLPVHWPRQPLDGEEVRDRKPKAEQRTVGDSVDATSPRVLHPWVIAARMW